MRWRAPSRTTSAPPPRPGKPVAFDALLPRPAGRLVRAARLAQPGRPVGLLPRRHRAPARPGSRRSARPGGWPSSPRSAPRWPARLDADEAIAPPAPRWSCPALADFCIVTLVDPDGRPRDVGSWHADPARGRRCERYAGLRHRRAGRRLTGRPRAADRRGRSAASGDDVRAARARARRATCSRAWRPTSRRFCPLRGRGRTLGLLTLYFAAGPGARRGGPGHARRTSPTAPGWPWTTPGSTARSSSWPRACSAACSPSRRSPTTPRSPCATCRPPRPPGWAATGTTPSCSPAGRRCW